MNTINPNDLLSHLIVSTFLSKALLNLWFLLNLSLLLFWTGRADNRGNLAIPNFLLFILNALIQFSQKLLAFHHAFLAETSDHSAAKRFAKITGLLINFKFLFEFVHKEVIWCKRVKGVLFGFWQKKMRMIEKGK